MEPNTSGSGRIRKATKRNFTIVPNEVLHSTSLSLSAIGLLSKLLSYPDNFHIYKSRLNEVCKEGRDACITAFNELVEAGYIISTRCIDQETRRFLGWEHLVYDEPQIVENEQPAPIPDFPETAQNVNGQRGMYNNTVLEKDFKLKKNIRGEEDTTPPPELLGNDYGEKYRTKVAAAVPAAAGEQRELFKQEMHTYMQGTKKTYPEAMWQDFYRYYCELNEEKGKIRRYDQRYFDLHGRLVSWWRDTHPDKKRRYNDAHHAKYGGNTPGRIYDLRY